ncbi:MAG: hypothetical protein KatS3mg111_2761 [Pirellulaceae bacterium]|nr:MAG: hypothetical protein KatS3mg111_2761 [Pirellulaceae bacterium]
MGERESALSESVRSWVADWRAAWNAFWFTPQLPHTLAIIRGFTGAMAAYIHLIWLSRIEDFFGEHAWVDRQTIQYLHADDWAWSWLWYVDSQPVLVLHQLIAIGAALGLAMGLATRVTAIVSWWLMIMVCHRATLALFGLDQIVAMLLMYLMVAQSGGAWSLDAWLRRRFPERWRFSVPGATVSNNLATRLIQVHLCVIYLFGGLSKMRGEMWFDGSALWYTLVNYEYQSLDMVWLGRYPWLISLLTTWTLFWEAYYCALVWPRLTRPFVLTMAVVVHGGIAIALGMPTFGWMMIVANMAFVAPEIVRLVMRWLSVGRVT